MEKCLERADKLVSCDWKLLSRLVCRYIKLKSLTLVHVLRLFLPPLQNLENKIKI